MKGHDHRASFLDLFASYCWGRTAKRVRALPPSAHEPAFMILNSYAILDAFVTLLRGLAGLLVVVLGLFAWWKGRGLLTPESRKALEDRGTLLFLLSFLLVTLNLVSWPLLY